MEYTYKPTIRAIQYTGDFNKVFDFMGGNVTRFEWINNDLQSHINIKTDNGVAVSTLRLGDRLVKETFEDGNATGGDVEYKTMSEDEFKKYYKEVDTPKSLEQAVCDTTESAADTTPCEGKPEQVGEGNQQLHDKIDLLMKYDNWRKQHDPVALDWRDEEQLKYVLIYNHKIGKIDINRRRYMQNIGALHFSSEFLAKRFYTEHKDLIHRVLGVQ